MGGVEKASLGRRNEAYDEGADDQGNSVSFYFIDRGGFFFGSTHRALDLPAIPETLFLYSVVGPVVLVVRMVLLGFYSGNW